MGRIAYLNIAYRDNVLCRADPRRRGVETLALLAFQWRVLCDGCGWVQIKIVMMPCFARYKNYDIGSGQQFFADCHMRVIRYKHSMAQNGSVGGLLGIWLRWTQTALLK